MSIRILAGFLALLVLCSGAVRAAEPVTFVSTVTPPFWSPDMQDDGWAGSMLKLLSDTAGVRYQIRYLPVKRFRASEEPFIVGDPNILQQVGQRAIFPISVFRSKIFTLASRHEPGHDLTLAQMRGHTLGVMRGTLEDKAAFAAQGIRIEESDSAWSLLHKLERGRVDYAIMVYEAGLHAIRELFPQREQEFVGVPVRGTVRPIAVMIDLGHPGGMDIARRYQRVLGKVLNSPDHHALLEATFGTSEVPTSFTDELNSFVEFYSVTWAE